MGAALKVLQFICPTGFYGAERWILALAKNLEENVQCDLAVTVEPGMRSLEICRYYRHLEKNVHEIPMQGRFDMGVIRRLVRLIKTEGYQIIHTHGYKSDILGLIAARLAGIKIVATPHGFENADDWKLKAYIGLGNQFLKWCDVVAPLSEQLIRDVADIGVSKQKIRYIQNGVDLDEVETQRQRRAQNPLLLEKRKKRVGFVGQMISRKNIFDLLDIFDQLQKKHGDLELKLLGDGDQRPLLEQHAATLASKDAIEFLGFRNDRLEWLQSFDLFVMTSTLEGIPRCLMETMAMGVPVAAYNIAGIDQLLKHEDTGLMATLGDRQDLAHQWERLLYDSELAEKIAENARQFVLEHFSGLRMAREYSSLFKEMTREGY